MLRGAPATGKQFAEQEQQAATLFNDVTAGALPTPPLHP